MTQNPATSQAAVRFITPTNTDTGGTITLQAGAVLNLTPGALQLYAYLLMRWEGAPFSLRMAANDLRRSRKAVTAALGELQERGVAITAPGPVVLVHRDFWAATPATENEGGAKSGHPWGEKEPPVGQKRATPPEAAAPPVVDAEPVEEQPSSPAAPRNTPTPPSTPPQPQTPASADPGDALELFHPTQPAPAPRNTPAKYRRDDRPEYTPGFNQFWELVTRKEAKAAAARLYDEALQEIDEELLHERAYQYYRLHLVEGTERRYVKSGKNWLRDRLYEDDLAEELKEALLRFAGRKGSRWQGMVPSAEQLQEQRLAEEFNLPKPITFADIDNEPF